MNQTICGVCHRTMKRGKLPAHVGFCADCRHPAAATEAEPRATEKQGMLVCPNEGQGPAHCVIDISHYASTGLAFEAVCTVCNRHAVWSRDGRRWEWKGRDQS